MARHEGVATGMGTYSYGAQLVVEADSSDHAVERAMAAFVAAASQAGLPDWPVTNVETSGEEEDMGWYEDIPDARERDGMEEG